MDKFGSIPTPRTKFQENLKELSKKAPDLWLEDFTFMNRNVDTVEKTPNEIYNLFTSWTKENNITYDVNPIKLGVQLSNLRTNGIEHGSKKAGVKQKVFDIKQLLKHYNIQEEEPLPSGCLITNFNNCTTDDEEYEIYE